MSIGTSRLIFTRRAYSIDMARAGPNACGQLRAQSTHLAILTCTSVSAPSSKKSNWATLARPKGQRVLSYWNLFHESFWEGHGFTGCGKTHDTYQAMPSGIA
jgi:hypothetical protein